MLSEIFLGVIVVLMALKLGFLLCLVYQGDYMIGYWQKFGDLFEVLVVDHIEIDMEDSDDQS